MKTEIVKLGVVGVDSGQLIICDPAYITSEFQEPDSKGKADHGHAIYRHKDDGSLWQFTYGQQPSTERVKPFPGDYGTIIPEYGMSPNELRQKEIFVPSKLDPTPHIPKGEFSYRGICKTTLTENRGGQLNYRAGHEGVAVAFTSGLGDGTYEVFAELIVFEGDKRIKKVWVELITDEDLEDSITE